MLATNKPEDCDSRGTSILGQALQDWQYLTGTICLAVKRVQELHSVLWKACQNDYSTMLGPALQVPSYWGLAPAGDAAASILESHMSDIALIA